LFREKKRDAETRPVTDWINSMPLKRFADEYTSQFAAVEPTLGFSELFEGLQIMIDADQEMAILPNFNAEGSSALPPFSTCQVEGKPKFFARLSFGDGSSRGEATRLEGSFLKGISSGKNHRARRSLQFAHRASFCSSDGRNIHVQEEDTNTLNIEMGIRHSGNLVDVGSQRGQVMEGRRRFFEMFVGIVK
jgi:hypothetical protein